MMTKAVKLKNINILKYQMSYKIVKIVTKLKVFITIDTHKIAADMTAKLN